MVIETANKLIEILLHLDKYLTILIQKFGVGIYFILFLIIFAETGLVITPFLPGDSLLFAVGAFAAQGTLDVITLFVILSIAAILGDSLNYSIGKFLGPKVFTQDSKYFKKEYLLKTEQFYEKHGPKTIVIARFLPIVRTFAPFVAGIGKMEYSKFIVYNIIGGISWVAIFIFGGYFFGNLPIVKENFAVVIIAIIALSLIPGIIEFIKHKARK